MEGRGCCPRLEPALLPDFLRASLDQPTAPWASRKPRVWWKAREMNNLIHFICNHHRQKNKRRCVRCVGGMFLSYSHPRSAHLSFPGHDQHISNASKMLIKPLNSCALLHSRAMRLKTEPSHLSVEQSLTSTLSTHSCFPRIERTQPTPLAL